MLKLKLFTSYGGEKIKTQIYARSLEELEVRTRRYLTEHKYELVGLSDKDGGSEMVYWRHYSWQPPGSAEDFWAPPPYGFPEAQEEYLDRNVTDDIEPFEYEANLDGDFKFSQEEWSLAVDGSISEEVFSSWRKALNYYIGHLKRFGRIVVTTEEDYEAYCLEAARARGDRWFTMYQGYIAERKGAERHVSD